MVDAWLPQYVARRYGATVPPQVMAAWTALRDSVYNCTVRLLTSYYTQHTRHTHKHTRQYIVSTLAHTYTYRPTDRHLQPSIEFCEGTPISLIQRRPSTSMLGISTVRS